MSESITELERGILDLYAAAFSNESRRVALICERTGLTPGRAMMLVSELIDSERALAYSPIVVRRLRRRRDHRQRSRSRRAVV